MQGRMVARYRIVAELGRGGMGVVYRAEDTRLGRTVALKFLPDDVARHSVALERFQREARAASSLNHPHICTIHDVDEHDGSHFIVMEALDGRTLAEVLASQRLRLDETLDVSLQVAEALSAAHAKGIIHRDIKPGNIFITNDGQVKILDFGLAKIAGDARSDDEAATNAVVTSPGQTLGTVAYMSPEQVRGEPLDARSDIFSFGGTIYEMLTGRRPFPGSTSGMIFDAILNRPPQGARELDPMVPAEMRRILDKALEKDRDLRYQSVREMRADLTRLKRDGSAAVVVGEVPRRSAPRVLIAAAVAAAAFAATAAAYMLWPRPQGAPAAGPITRELIRVTFEEGLQSQPAWSPDGKFIAYVSSASGNVDIWVQALGGGRAVRVTSDAANDWHPDWSPDGNQIVFRSERDGGGIYVVPAFGGAERKIAGFGYTPLWRPDGSSVLVVRRVPFVNVAYEVQEAYLLSLDGGAPQRVLERELADYVNVQNLVWHPDGQRITFRAQRRGGPQGQSHTWTAPVAGGAVVQSQGSPEFDREMRELAVGLVRWAPTGDALYMGALTRGVVNLWRAAVDPDTLQFTGLPVRLTTGAGRAEELALSRDGRRLAFVEVDQISRLWSLPFDAATRGATGAAAPLTPANIQVSSFDLSADGRLLVYAGARPGATRAELWQVPFPDGEPTLLGQTGSLSIVRVSRSGDRVAYRRQRAPGEPFTLVWALTAGMYERTLFDASQAYDWSGDGRTLLASCGPPPPAGLCTVMVDEATPARVRIVSDPDFSLWQGRYSPNGRWVLFNAQSLKQSGVSILGVAPAGGGAWRPLTEPRMWADKARWSPDGKTIYFISNRESPFFGVWGIEFDPEKGTTVGAEFRVTSFVDPARRVMASSGAELGVAWDRLVLPILERSGSIWVLDQVDR
jgi:Tol biopolymer transport system component/predicted Ser/Thr protein kinase